MSNNGEGYWLRTENGEIMRSSRGLTGEAAANYENGDTYIGDFIDGLRRGTGVYMYRSSGDRYEGNWDENVKSGFGKM